MRCKQCSSSFRLSIWIMQCGECREQYCTKCMHRVNGICYCEKCIVLITRPPNINDLMKLKAKDLREYLNRHNIATYGLVEKRELVDLLCNRSIPVKSTKSSVVFNKIFSNFESVLNLPDRLNGQRSQQTDRPVYASSSSGNLYNQSFSENRTSNTLPKERRPPPRPPQPSFNRPQPSAPPEATTSTADSPLPIRIPKLSDYSTADDLGGLTAKELKILLAYNRVDYKGCVEKGELLEKVERLWQDDQKQRQDLPDNVDDLCKICMNAALDCVLLECGHIATCIDCGKRLAECPICRQYVSRVVRTFKA